MACDAFDAWRGCAPFLLFAAAAFSRSACSFWALGLKPPIFTPLGLGRKSLMQEFSHVPGVVGSRFVREGSGGWVVRAISLKGCTAKKESVSQGLKPDSLPTSKCPD